MNYMITIKSFERSANLAEIKAVYRSKTKSKERTQILAAASAVDYLRSVWNKDTLELKEEFLMVCLNVAQQALGWVRISSGGYNSATADPRLIFSLALQVGSSAVIVAHNHPSGASRSARTERSIWNHARSMQCG
jgi:DNA repair protein RadC